MSNSWQPEPPAGQQSPHQGPPQGPPPGRLQDPSYGMRHGTPPQGQPPQPAATGQAPLDSSNPGYSSQHFPPQPLPPQSPPGYFSAQGQPQRPEHNQPQGQEPNHTRPERSGNFVIVLALIVGLVGGLLGGLGGALLVGGKQQQSTSVETTGNLTINKPEDVTQVTAAAAKASPSVVTIAVAGQEAGGSGTGVVMDDQGHIVTNNHVVTLGGQEADPRIQIKAADGQILDAELVGRDPYSDLAVLKVQAGKLPAIQTAESGKLNVGDGAIAIGAPLGLEGTVTEGIISRVNRPIILPSSALPEDQLVDIAAPRDSEDEFRYPGVTQKGRGNIAVNVIQTDAAINRGNSGGALVNTEGKLIGINVAIAGARGAGGNIGVGFAIPIDYAKRVVRDIIEHGKASHGVIGIQSRPKSTSDTGTSPFSVGAEVQGVAPDGPAAQAGIQPGDVVTSINGRRIEDALSLTCLVRQLSAGEEITVKYRRGNREEETKVTVADLHTQGNKS